MPIYEYRCKECGQEFSVLILNPKEGAHVTCETCGGADTSRLLSRFAFHQSEEARVDAFDLGKPRDDSFYKDDRNIGLWAKKKAKEMGVDLGKGFDETVEKARTGKFMEDVEK
ncbi:MAG: zinc ribbon domain-containing protein [Proteobacteria bacterium]|nr:zinc ribbon domain-containing protein [Pseudomonadota bacterium]